MTLLYTLPTVKTERELMQQATRMRWQAARLLSKRGYRGIAARAWRLATSLRNRLIVDGTSIQARDLL